MDILFIAIGLILGSIIAFIIANLLNKSRSVSKSDFDSLTSSFNETRSALSVAQSREADLNSTIGTLTSENASFSAQLGTLREEKATLLLENSTAKNSLANQKNEIDEIRKQSLIEFENLANKILESKSEKFTNTNRENIAKILEPLNEEIASFKKKVEETYDKESKERFSLAANVKELIEQTDKVSTEANNLATALKGQSKTRGDWGEVILERILEAAGLERGREYKVQQPMKNEEGETRQPDVLIYLPNERNLIIDSKVTLIAYENYCSAESDEDTNYYLKEHLKAIYTHIDQLQSKKYDEITTSLDFVLMFIPIEPAYLLAVQKDDQLWAKAYKKKIIMISPTNLMAVIKLVSDIWLRERQTKHAMEIAKQGQNLYDKFVGFLETMDDVGKHIGRTQDAYNKATNQLKLGRGNLISQAQKLKNLGLGTNKVLPASMVNFEDDFEDVLDVEVQIEPTLLIEGE